tara:strand:- start:8088 stop:8537 length:450 start_codon:yes stop_codon:yes gene_type:complete
MPKASVKRLIGSDKDKLIELVLAVDKYPEFIPYCLNSKIYEKKDQGDIVHMIADLTIGKGIFKDTYKSDVNYNKKKDIILVKNLDGPLKYLNNRWVFVEKGKSTEVSFEVDFELKNKFLNILMTKSFQYGLDKIADAFQKRAEKLYKNI